MQSRVDRTWTAHTRGSYRNSSVPHTCGTGVWEPGFCAPVPGAPLVPEIPGPDKEVANEGLSCPSPFSEYLPGSCSKGNVAP